MLRQIRSMLVALVVIFCPLFCGGSSNHPCHEAPTGDHCPCKSEPAPDGASGPCFCTGDTIPTAAPTIDRAAPVQSAWHRDANDTASLMALPRGIAASDRPPRSRVSQRTTPLII